MRCNVIFLLHFFFVILYAKKNNIISIHLLGLTFSNFDLNVLSSFYVSIQQDTDAKVDQDGSQCPRVGGDGGVLHVDLGDGHLGIHALQEGGKEVQRRRHGDHIIGWT